MFHPDCSGAARRPSPPRFRLTSAGPPVTVKLRQGCAPWSQPLRADPSGGRMGRVWGAPTSACVLRGGRSARRVRQTRLRRHRPRRAGWCFPAPTPPSAPRPAGRAPTLPRPASTAMASRLRGVAGYGSYRAGHPTRSRRRHRGRQALRHGVGRSRLGDAARGGPACSPAASSMPGCRTMPPRRFRDRGTRCGADRSAPSCGRRPTPDLQVTRLRRLRHGAVVLGGAGQPLPPDRLGVPGAGRPPRSATRRIRGAVRRRAHRAVDRRNRDAPGGRLRAQDDGDGRQLRLHHGLATVLKQPRLVGPSLRATAQTKQCNT